MDESKGGCDAERRSRGCARGSEHVLPVQRGTAAAGGSCCHGGGDEPGGGEASEHQCDGLQRVQVQVPARKAQQVRFCAAPRKWRRGAQTEGNAAPPVAQDPAYTRGILIIRVVPPATTAAAWPGGGQSE